MAADVASSPALTRESDVQVDSRGPLERDSFHAITAQTASGMAWTGVAMLLGFALRVLMARKMLPREMGIVLTAQAFVGLAVAVATLGVPDAIVRLVGIRATRDTAPKHLVYVGVKTVFVATVAAAAIALAALTLGSLTSADALWTAVIFIIALPLFGLGDVFAAAYRGVGRLGTKVLLIDVVRPLLVVLALLLSPVVLSRQAPYVAGLFALSALGSLTAVWMFFRRDGRWQSGGAVTAAELLRFGVPLAGAVLLAGPVFNSVLPLMLSAWTGPSVVAFYMVAVSMYGLVYLPVGILEQAATPTWAHMAAHDTIEALTRSFHRYTNLCFAGAAGLGLVIMANDRAILAWVFGPAFDAASGAVKIAVAATLCIALVGPNEGMLYALGLSRAIFNARFVGAVAGVGAGLILIPAYGLTGAVAAFAVTVVTVNSLYGVMLYVQTRIHPFTRRQVVTIGVAATGVLAATVLVNVYPVGGRVIATLIGLVILAAQADLRLAVRQLLRV